MMAAQRFEVLDGWRGVSILFVLACHLLPLGPKIWQLNYTAGLIGMSLFLTLSGFLITHFLLNRPNVIDFLIRRLFRIVPLAWLYILVTLLIFPVNKEVWMAHLFFYANYPPKPFIPHVTEHLWSLCVEIHFYIGVAILVALLKKRGLLLIPFICLAITLLRVATGTHDSVLTHLRVDEILAGGVLALIYSNKLGVVLINFVTKLNAFVLIALLAISSHPQAGFMMYFRPYFAALLVGTTLMNPDNKLSQLLNNKVLFYIATVSYALYVIHPLLAVSWLGSGEGWEKYMKRPLLFSVLFLSAHISTFYYEKHFIAFGKKLTTVSNSKLKYAKK